MAKVVSFHIVISGRVQGVAYRAWAKAKAEALGVTGWVRNLETGQVELLITGEEEKLNEMLKACSTGSFAAKVMDVHAHLHPTKHYDSFTIENNARHSLHG